jgi:hypothetical protein
MMTVHFYLVNFSVHSSDLSFHLQFVQYLACFSIIQNIHACSKFINKLTNLLQVQPNSQSNN